MSEDAKIRSGKGTSVFFRKLIGSESGTGFLMPVLVLWGVAFLLHLILNILLKGNQTVVIDEGLYTNIARSLARDGRLEFRAQPVNYPYLLYPMLLVPIYWLQRALGGDIYRMIQVLNTLLITSSVIPTALFAYDFTKDRKKAYLAALITAVMPDMLMGAYTMTESLIWPLSLWMVFFGYRYYANRKLGYGLLTALFAGLMYASKPGAVACGAVLLMFLCLAVLKNDRENFRRYLPAPVLLLVVIAAVHIIFQLLYRNSASLIGLYTKQTSEWHFKTVFVALEAFFLQTFLFVFACGGVYGVLPLTHLDHYEPEQRSFVTAFTAGVLLTILGTAVFVVPYTWNDSLGTLPLHLRYCAMYIPVMMVFSLGIRFDGKKTGRTFVLVLAIIAVLSLFPGARAGFVDDKTTEFDSMALSSFTTMINHNGHLVGWIVTVLTLMFLLYVMTSVLKKGFTGGLQKSCLCFFAGFVLINAVSAHINMYTYIDPTIAADAREINELIRDKDCLGITQRRYSDYYSYWLESRLSEPMQQVTVEQMFLQMDETGGVYTPFVPVEQSPNVHNHETPDTDHFVLGMTIAEHLELNESTAVRKTSAGHFSFVTIDPAHPWVDTMMYGMDDNVLPEGVTGYIAIFNENRNLDGKMILTMTASGSGILDVGGAQGQLSEEARRYEITLPFDRYIELKPEGASAEILTYSTAVR